MRERQRATGTEHWDHGPTRAAMRGGVGECARAWWHRAVETGDALRRILLRRGTHQSPPSTSSVRPSPAAPRDVGPRIRGLSPASRAHRAALEAYLRENVRARSRDAVRLAALRSTTSFNAGAAALTTAIASDEYHRYLEGLARVTPLDRVLVIARMELGYSDQQIALVMHAQCAEDARVAVSGALLRLSREMSHA